jgi:NADPH:quinone reductase-like Zn-dependent oxidoreductase
MWGMCAEYVKMPGVMAARVPEHVDMEAASTVGVGALTALTGLFDGDKMNLPVQAEPTGQAPVLVYGASSTVGAYAISLLKGCGYRALAVASTKHHSWLKETLGADQVVDYKDDNWMQAIAAEPANAGMLHAFDAIGGSSTAMCDQVLQLCGAGEKGMIASVDISSKQTGPSKVFPYSIGFINTSEEIQQAGKKMKLIEKMLTERQLQTMPFEVIGSLDDVLTGLEMLKAGKVRGTKLVVKV